MPLILARNPLVFPGGAPGFNPNHVAAKNIVFSGVAVPTGTTGSPAAINVLTGAKGALTSASGYTGGMDGTIGPVNIQPSGNAGYQLFPVAASQTDTTTTFGVIVTGFPTGTIALFSVGSASNGPGLRLSSLVPTFANWNGSNYTSSGVTLTASTPYFLAVSLNLTTCNFVTVNLRNGQTKTSSVAGGAQTSHNTNVIWQSVNVVGNFGGSNLAAAMYSTAYMSLAQLLAWAQAPWDFWYPPTVGNLIFSGLAKPAAGDTLMGSQAMVFV